MKTAVALIVTLLFAQGPARDTPAITLTGTATIRGTVTIDDQSGKPVRLAKVRLVGAGGFRELIETTDESGRFVYRQLAAGRYTVSVTKPGFVAATYGAKRPGGPGVPIVIGDGAEIDVAVKLMRGAVITGTVRGPAGEPVSNVRIQIFENDIGSSGELELQPRGFGNSGIGSLITDERGAYRIYGLRPGEYYVAATATTLDGVMTSAAALDWATRAIAAPLAPLTPAPPQGQSVALAPVLYPGTVDPAAAAPIAVAAGEERSGVDIALQFVPTATVSGVVRDPSGQPPKIAQLSLVRPGEPFGMGGGSHFIRPESDGRFSTSGVLPGQYVLAARGSATGVETNAPTGPMAQASMPLWALVDVLVSGRDITDLDVKLAPGVTIAGRLAFQAAELTPPANLSNVSVSLSSLPSPRSTSMGVGPTFANADGTFVIRGVGPGQYRLSANIPGAAPGTASWSLRSSMLSGRDTLDFPFEVRNDDIAGATITFTDRPTELSGTLLDAGRPAPEYFVVVFSADRTFWTPQSRRVRSVRPGNSGAFRIVNLPPGEYYVCALTDLEQNRLTTPGFLEPLVAASLTMTFGEGEKKVQDLNIAR